MGKSHNGSWYGRKNLEMILLALMFLTLKDGKRKRDKSKDIRDSYNHEYLVI